MRALLALALAGCAGSAASGGSAGTPDAGRVVDACVACGRADGAAPDAAPPDAAHDAGRIGDATADATHVPADATHVVADAAPPDAAVSPACAPAHAAPAYARPADDGVALDTLLEASGYAPGADWVGLAAGHFCRGPELVTVKNAHSFFSILRGPVPHAVGSGDLDSDPANPWRAVAAADLDGDGTDEVIAVRHVTVAGVPDVVVARADAQCHLTQVASARVGNPGNSDWIGVTAGDFDGDGHDEIVALKAAHSHFVMLRLDGATLRSVGAGDADSDDALPWRAITAADLNGDGTDEIVAAREAPGDGSTVLAYGWNGTGRLAQVAHGDVGHDGNSAWTGATAGDFDGDGRESVVLQKDRHSNFIVLDLPPGTGTLNVRRAADLASARGQGWRGVAAVDWLDGDGGAKELVALRHATAPYRANVFVYGDAFHRAEQTSAIAGTEAQYAGEPHPDANGPADLRTLLGWLTETHAGTYDYLLWDDSGQDYLDFVRFLDATRDTCIDGRQLRVWVTLIPPTEHRNGRCSTVADSPLTPFDDTSLIGAAGCEDYVGWGKLIGRLAAQYPHLVAVNVDDFSYSVDTAFTPEVIAKMQSAMRSQAPWLSLVPTLYYATGGTPAPERWPDLGQTLDGVLFYFTNAAEGDAPCAACPPPGMCPGACLQGTCAEATVPNAPAEIAHMAAMLPPDRRVHLGAYFTGHSKCGTPTPAYDADLFEAALAQPAIGGVHVYTTQHPQIACTPDTWTTDKGCVVQHVFAEH